MSTPKPHFSTVRCETDRATNVRTVLLSALVDGLRLWCEEPGGGCTFKDPEE